MAFWDFSDFDQVWDFGPLIYCRNTLNNTRNKPTHVSKYYFCTSQIYGTPLFLKTLKKGGCRNILMVNVEDVGEGGAQTN